MSETRSPIPPAGTGEPTWQIAHLFPHQGDWSEEEYLALTSNRLVEYTHGHVEVLPMPTTAHQLIVAFVYGAMLDFISSRGLGTILFAPLRVRLWPGKFREPDVVFLSREHKSRMKNEYWEGADLAVEVVSDDDRRRDVETKREEYAQAGIPEYWIVDPRAKCITVLKLEGDAYAEHGVFIGGTKATSILLDGFAVAVDEVFASAAEMEA